MRRTMMVATPMLFGAALGLGIFGCQRLAEQCELTLGCPTGGTTSTSGGGGGADQTTSTSTTSSTSSAGGGGADMCVPGETADCNGDPADGCEAHLRNNGDHCGACQHSCDKGGCQEGLCMPFPIVSDNVGAIVQDEAHLYFVTSGTVARVAKDGVGGISQLFSDNQVGNFIGRITSDETTIFWLITGSSSPPTGAVMRIEKDGTGFAVIASGLPAPLALAVDGSSVYWILNGTSPDYVDRTLVKANKDGTGSTVLLASLNLSGCVVSDGSFVYYLDNGMYRMSADGATKIKVGTATGCPVITPSGAYFMSSIGLRKIEQGSDQPITVKELAKANYLQLVAARGEKLYFTDGSSSPASLWWIDTAGNDKQLISPLLYPQTNVVADDKALYWATSIGTGYILKLVQ